MVAAVSPSSRILSCPRPVNATKIFDTCVVGIRKVIVPCDVHAVSCTWPMRDGNVPVPTGTFANGRPRTSQWRWSNDRRPTERIVPTTTTRPVHLCFVDHGTNDNKSRYIQSVTIYSFCTGPSSRCSSPDRMRLVSWPKRYNQIVSPYPLLDTIVDAQFHYCHYYCYNYRRHPVPSLLVPTPPRLRHPPSCDHRQSSSAWSHHHHPPPWYPFRVPLGTGRWKRAGVVIVNLDGTAYHDRSHRPNQSVGPKLHCTWYVIEMERTIRWD